MARNAKVSSGWAQPCPRTGGVPYARGHITFFLLTGRGSSAQWHTQSRTAKSAVLRKLYPDQIYVEINPDDAKRLGIETGELVEVSSRRGQLEAVAFVTGTVAPGQVFIPMHYVATNELTFPAFDPLSRQPAYKSAAVRVAKR